MRKITMEVVGAFLSGRNRALDNTASRNGALYLHGNKIAEYRNRALWITTAGWDTPTTRDRLNGLHNVSVHHEKHVLYLNGKRWNGEWVHVGDFSKEEEKARPKRYPEPTISTVEEL